VTESFTTGAAGFAQAVRNIALFAYPDARVLPALAGVHLECAGQQVTLTASDRYSTATQVIDLLAGGDRPWEAWLTADAVARVRREISTGRKHGHEMVTVEPRPGGGAAIVTPGGAVITSVPDPHSPAFPVESMRRMAKGFTPAPALGRAESLRFDPALLARFASVGGRGDEPMILVPGAVAAEGGAYPVRVTCGPVEALVMTKPRGQG
jgi:hypothetical protein